VVVTAAFGLIGYLMMRYRFPRVTMVIALILGEIAERSFFQSLNMASGDWTIFFTRAPSLILLALTLACLAYPSVRALRGQKAAAE
jgi:putative tricarboxylic transport membrane protein